MPITVRVPAKVNLVLSVGAPRADGYHELSTVYQAVGLHDTVTVSRAPGLTCRVSPAHSDAFSTAGAAAVPTNGDNLAARAVRRLAELTGRDPAVHIEIAKAIPVAGGMAGGSADAAAALVAAAALWELPGRDLLEQVAAELGSDVPFLLHGGTALGTGRGEVLTPVLAAGSFTWVLALAAEGLSTAAVYAEFDRGAPVAAAPPPLPPVLAALRAGDPHALGAALSNDLQPAALRLRPALAEVLDAGRRLGALGGVVSGSGPTVALLAASPSAATVLAAGLHDVAAVAAVRIASGPVPGARISD